MAPKSTKAGKNTKSRPRRSPMDKYNDPELLLADEKSPLHDLNTAQLKAILTHPTILPFLRSTSVPIDAFLSLPTTDQTRALADFTTDGAAGRHDSNWVEQALAASQARKAGAFEEYLAKNFEEVWGEEDEEKDKGDINDGVGGGAVVEKLAEEEGIGEKVAENSGERLEGEDMTAGEIK
ncbi:hypothetical protein BGZ60DRAFT_398936 [Tricladium varicosporioides]|nr:hypothetical protein BGZ60DRAFT_398936 [Hymenoscyphus varicosporioides]